MSDYFDSLFTLEGKTALAADIGGVAIPLCSRAGAYMTGSVVTVSGGTEL